MARDTVPSGTATLYQLQQPEKLHDVIQKDKPDDCLSCRITGATAFIGLGAYSYFSGQHQLGKQRTTILKSGSRFGMKSREYGITSIAVALVGMGLWRLVN
ncbi:hypothetical protein MMC14_006589 [Varicellaria rhodocarpa]|nr:hypothetical protein [Varicellaria rhodocarpa]